MIDGYIAKTHLGLVYRNYLNQKSRNDITIRGRASTWEETLRAHSHTIKVLTKVVVRDAP